jgi:hypothetical protein
LPPAKDSILLLIADGNDDWSKIDPVATQSTQIARDESAP